MAIPPPITYAPGSDNPLPSSAVYDVNGIPTHVSIVNPMPVAVTNGGTASSYVVQLLYTAINSWADANGTVNINDLLQNITAYDNSGNLILEIWVDISQGFTLGAPPPSATYVTPYSSSGGLTNAELRASPVPFTTTQLPTTLGQKTSALSTSVTIAPDAGVATSALQTAGNTSLNTIATKTTAISAQLPTALGQTLSAGSLSVVMASDATAPLPTGAATAALQTTGNTSLATIATKTTAISNQLPTALGQALSAGSVSTVLASDATLPLPTGASTASLQTTGNATLTAISGKLPPALGLQSQANSLSVVVANSPSGNTATPALYKVLNAFTGASVDDILQAIEFYAPGAPSTLISTTWINLNTGLELASAPTITDIKPITGGSASGDVVTTFDFAANTTTASYNKGDAIQQVNIINPLTAAVISTTWNNVSQGTVIAPPVLANLTAVTSQLPPALGPQSAADSLSVYVQNPAAGSTSVVNTYTVTTGWTDGSQAISIGETLQQILIFNSSGVLTATIWFDVDLAYTLVSPPPSYALITQVTSSTATAINQTTQITAANLTNTNLSTISSQLPNVLGQTTSIGSVSTVLASDATLPLPTGAATSALQTSGNTSLTNIATSTATTATQTTQTANNTAAISGKLPPTLGQGLSAGSLSTVLASDATLPLPTGAATSALQTAGNSSLTTIATQTTNTATSVSAISAQLPVALGPQLAADSLSVVVANPSGGGGDVFTQFNYSVVIAFTGALLGDTVARFDIYTPGSPPTLVSETWFNVSQGTTISAPPDYTYVSVASSNTVTPVLPQATPTLIVTSTSGTIAAGAKQISLANNGSAGVTVDSAVLPSGASVDFIAPSGGTIGALTYDATGSSLLIATLV